MKGSTRNPQWKAVQRPLLAAAAVALAVILPAQPAAALRVDPFALPRAGIGRGVVGAAALADSSRAGQQTPPSSSIWASRQQEGPLWRADRLQHLSLSTTLVVAAGTAGAGDLEAALIAAALGAAKEATDAAGGRGISRLDLLADLVGIGVGLAILSATR